MALTYRELSHRPADLELLAEFYAGLYVAEFPDPNERESLDNLIDYLRRKAEGWYGRNNYHIVLAMEGDRPLAGSISDYLAEAGAGVIEFLLVDPDTRGRGLGRAILEHTEALLRADARDGARLGCVAAEINDPLADSGLADNLDPAVRARIWHAWGYRRLDFRYVQPALSADQEPVTNLLLVAKPLRPDWTEAMPGAAVLAIVGEYLRWAMRIDEPDRSPEYRRMAAELAAADQVRHLSLATYTDD